ncbi:MULTISPECIES: DUF5130 family protein [unclassified Nocardioides]|uniref:DUF5130 family protein n=1 Tax=unclassified Nocardioides TaxID=2615069 RepID=UPI00005707AB|nr:MULTISPECIES: DUF5130 family protein [unclassified Nocardioides]ABL80894.1 hypothetical protein Noca_1380 [Nocardioides sp. JS614]
MRGGELGAAERFAIEDAIRTAEQVSRYEFSVFIGRAEGDPHAFATRLHGSLVAPERSVLILVDPTARALEIVTGAIVRSHLTDPEVELTALQMQTSFTEGDLVGGLRRGIQMLADHARGPDILHSEHRG